MARAVRADRSVISGAGSIFCFSNVVRAGYKGAQDCAAALATGVGAELKS